MKTISVVIIFLINFGVNFLIAYYGFKSGLSKSIISSSIIAGAILIIVYLGTRKNQTNRENRFKRGSGN